MEQVRAITDRIRLLKSIAASMHEGAIHTRFIPEVDKILALPDDLGPATISEREAISRQVREYEQAFDRLGYTLLDQIMPATGVSAIFRVVQAADEFKARLRPLVDSQTLDALTRYSLSIGTPPVTAGMKELVARTLFGADLDGLAGHLEMLRCDRRALASLLDHLRELVDGSLHYSTASEEKTFLSEAARFINFEGASFLNRVVITESPERVLDLVVNHVFDKFGPQDEPGKGGEIPVRLVERPDRLDAGLFAEMQAYPNMVFVAPVTRIPHGLFRQEGDAFRGVLGRLLLVDVSPRARRSNTTIVYTLFPHVARTLRNIQTSASGRPANTQQTLRRILERFPAPTLSALRGGLEARIGELAEGGAFTATVEELRSHEWQRSVFFDALALTKLRRAVAFLEGVASYGDEQQAEVGEALRQRVAKDWMRYFYSSLDPATYRAAVLPGGGRGALRLVGEHHRDRVGEEVDRFVREDLAACRARLADLKEELKIPAASSDEIEAAKRQSNLRSISPTQWRPSDETTSRGDYLSRTLTYRVADLAGRVAKRAEHEVDRAAFGNVSGAAAALLKRTMTKAGLGALHGHIEDKVLEPTQEVGRKLRLAALGPVQGALRAAFSAAEGVKGEIDPVALGEVEAVLHAIDRGAFYPALVLPEMSWSYPDVFPDKDFPRASTLRIPLNARYEMDPSALLERLEQLRYVFRRFPEIFRLHCRSMLLVINSPHNPTSVVWRRETILKLLQIAAEYDITICDDDSYHRVLTKKQKAHEGDDSVAQIYEQHRDHLGKAVRIHTVGATTKALQGSGDRTGLLHSNDPACIDSAEKRASRPHLMSLYVTQLKLESGLAVKRYTAELGRLAADLLRPGGGVMPWDGLRAMLERELAGMREESSPVAAFQTLLLGYEELLRLRQRDASVADLSAAMSTLVRKLKSLRLDKRLCEDVERRIEAFERARAEAFAGREHISPEGAFYACVRLAPPGDERGVPEFLAAMARHRKVDVTWAGKGFVRLSLGGSLPGDEKGYERYETALTVYLGLLARYWERFEAAGRDVAALDGLFTPPGEDALALLKADLAPLLQAHPPQKKALALPVEPSERGIVYCIEEGRSVADKIFVQWQRCETVDELLRSRTFRVVYRRLLKRVIKRVPSLGELGLSGAENQYGPLACLAAYHDRQLIDDVFRKLLGELYREWQGAGLFKVLLADLEASQHGEKAAALAGIDRQVSGLVRELLHAFDAEPTDAVGSASFAIGCEMLTGMRAHPALPDYLASLITRGTFTGASDALHPKPSYVTGAAKRVADYRYGFTRRDGGEGGGSGAELGLPTSSGARPGGVTPSGAPIVTNGDRPPLAVFRRRLALFAERADLSDYLCKAEQVGPFKMLVVIHKSFYHLISDELRLYPQIEDVQLRESLDEAAWDGLMLFGIPTTAMGECYRTGYVLDRRADGALFPTAWVAREDATDYVGFFKKTLLTLHNERVKAMGGMPVHGSMITLTFKNGLRKTLVFSADSGTGKSETITAMMDQVINTEGPAAELSRVDILSGDMLSLWRGEDEQIYGFGTETGDFLRLTDITESWKGRFGDLLERGSYSNLDHPKNPRVTIPGICDEKKLLSPTRVNCFFYIDNYSKPQGSAIETSDNPDQILRHVLVRGLRKNKGTSGDQPSLRAGLELAGKAAVLSRFGHAIDELVSFEEMVIDGQARTCLSYRDGEGDVHAAAELVTQAFRGQRIVLSGKVVEIQEARHDVLANVYRLRCSGGAEVVLDREVYDQIYEPIVGTFCGNPFVEPEGMDRVLETFARTMRRAKVQTGVLKTQLARDGYSFSGPAKAASDIVTFLLEDEEVNARFQRNKDKVQRAMERTFSGVLDKGTNLPVELEGYNLLLLEAHESTHVAFLDLAGRQFTLSTPFYRFSPENGADRGSPRARTFVPALALPEIVEAIRDICDNPDLDLDVSEMKADLWKYDRLRHYRSLEELTYQVLLVDGVVTLGSSELELSRFPTEVRKAAAVAQQIKD
jgi:hypothetical protein